MANHSGKQAGTPPRCDSRLIVYKISGPVSRFRTFHIDMLQDANKSITIVCDFPCYCRFSDYPRWVSYKAAIEKAVSKDLVVSITCLNEARRRELFREQFHFSYTEPDRWKTDAEVRRLLAAFIKRNGLNTTIEQLDFTEFENQVEALNGRAFQNTFEGIRPAQTSDPLPIFFWIVDGITAVFSVPCFTEHDREQGFITSDTKLISALAKIGDRLKTE